MMRILTGLADNQPRKKRQTTANRFIEPHVKVFDIDSTEKKYFVFPFQLITAFLFAFIIIGFVCWFAWEDNSATFIVVALQLAFAPFYLPGLYLYNRYLKRENHTEVELDKKNRLIKYSNSQDGRNLLFHESQIEKCEISLSIFVPYRLDYIHLHLKGGRVIVISSLIVEPKEILKHFSFPYQIRKRWVNPFPVVK